MTDSSSLLDGLLEKIQRPTPVEEEDIFANLSHFSLDIITLFAKKPLTTRAFLFLGRIFSLSSEYVVTHHIRTDELAFQITMIAFSGTLFVSSLNREFSLISEALSKAEMRLYSHLKSCLTASEYKSLLKKTAEPKFFAPGATVINEYRSENNDSLLWLLEGSFSIANNGGIIRENVKKFDSCAHGFLGDVCFLDRLYSEQSNGIPLTTIVAGEEGAKFLVFDGKKLRKEMKRCKRYDSCLRGFLARGMQKKISDLVITAGGVGVV
ncbi:hypothetical protein TrVE_jg10360 [Triparma verrucosa]|uniref:Uncharacterized protein n=1 Tax=Triparma verrucosa TaxID=1606542 RepID=A0A9W7BYR7_9STRA|nr:hypothetical protein TrVE_jg10360 [Triparma verrucosa]